MWGLAGYPVIVPPPPFTSPRSKRVDSHLRSARFIKGYKVVASDGAVGELADFMIDGRRWMIREIVVEFGPWYGSKVIHIPTEKVAHISYDESTVYVSLAKEAMADVNESDLAPSLASSNMEI